MAVETKKATSKKERELLEACRQLEQSVCCTLSMLLFMNAGNRKDTLLAVRGLFKDLQASVDNVLKLEEKRSWI